MSTIIELQKQTKACLFTLIIYADNKHSVDYLQELTDSILGKFPCRIIFIHPDVSLGDSYLKVKTSTILSGPTGNISCDCINIDVSKDMLPRIPLLVTPHIVPDLPLYLLWGQNPFEERDIFPFLQQYATRVIFDSECSNHLDIFCQEMLKNLKILGMEVMDINWALINSWRDIFHQIFDTPEKIEDLRSCSSMTITYNENTTKSQQHPEIRSIYLQGWIAARLGWKYKQTEKLSIQYETTDVILTPTMITSLPAGAITTIDITTSQGRNYLLKRQHNLSQVVVHVSTKNTCDLPFTLPLKNAYRGLTFMKEIFYNKLGSQYAEMLQTISKQSDATKLEK